MREGTNGNTAAGRWGVVLAFVILAAVFVLLRGDYARDLTSMRTAQGLKSTAPAFACVEINTCMRVGTVAVAYGLDGVLSAVAELLYGDPGPSSPIHQAPWSAHSPPPGEKLLVVRSSTFFLQRFVFLVPILWMALVFYRGTVARLAFVTLVFVALAGWPFPVLDAFFGALSAVADWPLSYFTFKSRIEAHDFGSIGYVVLLCLYIARRERIVLWECAALTLAGQLIFENNGVVTGVALFVATLLAARPAAMSARLRLAGGRLAVAGVASASLAALFVMVYVALGATDGAAARTPTGSVVGYFTSYWEEFGRVNLSWANVLAANFATMVMIPIVFGAGFGALVALADRGRDPAACRRARSDCAAGFAVAAGFCVTLAVGFFVSGLSSDMGRQLAPLVAVTLIFAAKLGEWLVRRALPAPAPAAAD